MEQPPPPPPKPPSFALPVDSEHKATELRIFSFAPPHMRSFHLSWFSFFACFCSTFASPPLLPIIRDNLSLTATDISNAGIAAVSGAVLARLAMGSACDLIGPRLASASLTLLTTPAVFFTSVISSPTGFLLVRFFTGFSIASFVSTQYWMSSMFSAAKVGQANGLVGGWGNLGGGAIQLIMPFIFELIKKLGCAEFTAWRVAFFVPGLVQMASAIAVLAMGQDCPDGDFVRLRKTGEMKEEGFDKVFWNAITNYRGWILAITYGYCFGVELAVDNIIAEYYYDRFDLNLHTAGIIAASFGLANVVSRPGGGWISDRLAARFGMRGRLWGLWIVQTAGGVLCVVLGRMGRLSLSVLVMVFFSLCVQAACGLTFGIVPFISRRSEQDPRTFLKKKKSTLFRKYPVFLDKNFQWVSTTAATRVGSVALQVYSVKDIVDYEVFSVWLLLVVEWRKDLSCTRERLEEGKEAHVAARMGVSTEEQ